MLLLVFLGVVSALTPLEDSILAAVQPERMREQLRELTSFAHVFGTPESLREAQLIAQQWQDIGYFDSVEIRNFSGIAYLPERLQLSIESPVTENLTLVEPPGPEGELEGAWPLFSGYSHSGRHTGQVVYANYCRKQDFEYLRDVFGVSVAGKITLCRYGLVYRGLKAKYSQEFGALASLFYSDPADDGYGQGVEFPQGPARNSVSGQRGSVSYGECPGDPSELRMRGICQLSANFSVLPTIPSQPIAWSQADKLLRLLEGTAVRSADGWQGGLPLHYRLGDSGVPLVVTLEVQHQPQVQRTGYNVIARRLGSKRPEERVIVGCHHDSWEAGAQDPISGIVAMTEAARALHDAGAPRALRTIEFAAWDGEEYALIGSTHYAETNAEELAHNGVYYLNFDGVVSSTYPDRVRFTAEASAVLEPVIRSAASKVPYLPGPNGTTLADRLPEEPFGLLGDGSDFVAFLQRLGVSSAGFDFYNDAYASVYHSVYDSFWRVDQLTDPDFRTHAMAAQFIAVLLQELDALEVPGSAPSVARSLLVSKEHLRAQFPSVRLDWSLYDAAQRDFQEAAEFPADPQPVWLLERRAFLDSGGLPGRPYFRNLLACADLLDGYASQPLPGIAYYARAGDEARAQQELHRVVEAIRRATAHLGGGAPPMGAASIVGIVAAVVAVVATAIVVVVIRRRHAKRYDEI